MTENGCGGLTAVWVWAAAIARAGRAGAGTTGSGFVEAAGKRKLASQRKKVERTEEWQLYPFNGLLQLERTRCMK